MSKRESFTNRLGFILACIGSAVGMGNIWMFPTRVSLYGGGSYLIPYFIFVVLIASTGVIGEMSFGRGTRSGPIDAFGAACESRDRRKVGETLGFIPVLGSLAMAIGYTVVMGWILKYMIGTFTGSTLAPNSIDSFAASFGGMASAFGNNLWQIIALVVAVIILMFGVGNVYAKWIINYMRKHAITRTRVYGRENIPTDSNYIMYPNHQGKYDALGIILAQEKPCGVLWGKKQAERLMSRQVCGLIDAVVIDLDNNRDKVRAIMDVTRQVKLGRNFLIFPEGGYTDNKNELQEFQAGCFSCSLQTKTPIVPIALFDSYKSMNSNTFERVDTQVHFLKPILYSEYGELKKKEVAKLVKSRIEERMAQIKAGKINESYELIG